MSLFSIISLSSFFGKKHVPIYIYSTEEFLEKSNEMKYNLNDAIDIYCNYVFDVHNVDSIWFYAEVIYGEDYVFTQIPYNAKTNQYFIYGLLINGETGNVKKIDRTKSIKLQQKPTRNVIRITKEEFYANGGSYLKKENKKE